MKTFFAQACCALFFLGFGFADLSVVEAKGAAKVRMQSGLEAFRQSDYQTARNIFARLRRDIPKWTLPKLYWAMSQFYVDPSDDELLRILRDVARAMPANPRGHIFLGRLFLQRGEPKNAAQALSIAALLRPQRSDLHFWLGRAYEDSQQVELAIKAYETAGRLRKKDATVLLALAGLYEQEKRFGDAEKALLEMISFQPKIVYHRRRLAQFYLRTQREDEAKEVFRVIDTLDPRTRRKMRSLKPSR